jgi:hypothetical protein
MINQLCPWCLQSFRPNPRLRDRQKSCGQPACKKKQKNHSHARWKKQNAELYQAGQKDWRAQNSDYWKNYRASHPQYTANNRNQSKLRKALSWQSTGLQKRIDILQLTENNTLFWNIPRFAKSPRSLIPLLFAKTSLQISLGETDATKYQP